MSEQPDSDPAGKVAVSRELRIEQAMERYLAQLESGIRLDRQAFLELYPDIADELDGQLEAIELLQVASPQIAPQQDVIPDTGELGNKSRLGDFLLIRPIGRGGMGIVYKAVQLSLDRSVAVKVLPFAALLNPKQRKRFQNEARAAATLDHPNIVPVLFTGVERGVHFYAMQLIEGQSLAEVIRAMRGIDPALDNLATQSPSEDEFASAHPNAEKIATRHDPSADIDAPTLVDAHSSTLDRTDRDGFYRSVASIGAQAGEALQYAHENGVVHRDVKPGNLMLDETGKVWITDFGLARHERNDTITMDGDVLGTLAYMSPEQRSGSQLADARSDVYSLGATLYELLSLKQPFGDQGHSEVTHRSDVDPTPLRRINSAVPVDLETIIRKAMAGPTQERYQSAGEFAEDLNRFCNGRTIRARRPTLTDRLVKWSARHRSIAVAVVAGIVGVSLAFAIATALVLRAQRDTQAALIESERYADQVADLLYVSDIQLAYQAWNSNRPEQVPEILDRHRPQDRDRDRRGLEWHLLSSLAGQPTAMTVGTHDGAVNQIAVFPDRRRVASVGSDKMLRLWDLQTGTPLASISMGDTSVEVPFSVAISPDGKTVATGSDTVVLWDATSGELIKELTSFEYNVQSITYSPDGKLIACGSRYDRVSIFNDSGELVHEIDDSSRHESLVFTPDSKYLIVPSRRTNPGTNTQDGFIQIWETESFSSPLSFPIDNQAGGNFIVATCAPDGSFLLACEQTGTRPARVIEPSTGEVLLDLTQSRDRVNAVSISEDSKTAVCAYSDGTIGYWHLLKDSSGRLTEPHRQSIVNAHNGKVMSVKFVDNSRVISCGADGQIKLWELADTVYPLATNDRHIESITIEVASDGETIGSISPDATFRLFSPDRVVKAEHAIGPESRTFACSADFSMFAIWSSSRSQVEVRSAATGTVATSFPAKVEPADLCFSPDGHQLAVINPVGDLWVWDLKASHMLAKRSIDGAADGRLYHCQYSKDGRRLVCVSEARGVDVLSVSEFQVIANIEMLSNTLNVAFTADGTVLATAHDDGVIRLWDWASESLIGELKGHRAPVRDICIVENDSLLSISNDGSTRIWSLPDRRLMATIEQRDSFGACISASTDGNVVCVGYEEYPQSLLIIRLDAEVSERQR